MVLLSMGAAGTGQLMAVRAEVIEKALKALNQACVFPEMAA
jgi:hypothetical protein